MFLNISFGIAFNIHITCFKVALPLGRLRAGISEVAGSLLVCCRRRRGRLIADPALRLCSRLTHKNQTPVDVFLLWSRQIDKRSNAPLKGHSWPVRHDGRSVAQEEKFNRAELLHFISRHPVSWWVVTFWIPIIVIKAADQWSMRKESRLKTRDRGWIKKKGVDLYLLSLQENQVYSVICCWIGFRCLSFCANESRITIFVTKLSRSQAVWRHS